ncbi:hypothetical protein QJS10_CPB20g01278 [Acorus calamus]|uniref:Uncharacterized protein n=1 Tax=Acorus calamus TaxID=4465 RepID=A0AAV9CD54_ACOCL|nr:hypothetical protein QJS10_CPB20g01278 [Acorus calamus]
MPVPLAPYPTPPVHRVNLCVQAVGTSYFIQLEQHLFVVLCAMQSLLFHLQATPSTEQKFNN